MTKGDYTQKVAVFGATTVFGALLTRKLLEEGYHVNGIIKSAKMEHHHFLHEGHSSHFQLFELDIFDDATRTNTALDHSLEGVDCVFDCTRRSYWGECSADELIEQTKNIAAILLDAVRRARSIKQVIITSHSDSCGMLTPREDQTLPHGHPGYVFNEEDWTDMEKCLEMQSPYGAYIAGQTAVEKYALNWALEQPNIKVVSLCCGNLLGNVVRTNDKMDTFMESKVAPLILGSLKEIPRGYIRLTHTNDAVNLHVFAMEKKLEGRYLCVGHQVEWVELVDCMRKILPKIGKSLISGGQGPPSEVSNLSASSVPRRISRTESEEGSERIVKFSCMKIKEAGFGFKYSLEDMCRDFSEALTEAFGTTDGGSPSPEISNLFAD